MTAHIGSAVSSSVAWELVLTRFADRLFVALVIIIGGLGLLTLLMGASETALVNSVAIDALGEARGGEAWQMLGEPVHAGQPSGVVVTHGAEELVEVVVPVRGGRSRGKLYATAVIEQGEPRLTAVRITVGKNRLAIPLATAGEEGR